jgi:DNA-binding ferritin-like protein
MSGEIVHMMMTLYDQVKIYHWQTMHFPRHEAAGKLIEALDDHIDSFVETYMGKYGRPKLAGKTTTIHLRNFQDKQAPALLKEAIDWLSTDLTKKLKPTDTDLLNIRDEIVAVLNRTLYLFTLN